MKKGQLTICILHRGWVVVGKMTAGDWVHLDNTYVIRRWGSTKGLGEIASEGPKENTILDECPPMNIPVQAIINTIECNEKAWGKWIKK